MGATLVPDEKGDNEPAFHHGERAVQARVGVRERMALLGARVMRDFMPEQHRDFFNQLPFLIVGSVDQEGQPWASVLAGPAGFVTSPDPHHLVIAAQPLATDPLHDALQPGAALGLLGLEPFSRRRNRMNGVVSQLTAQGFAVQVRQSFGNCPKYIQARRSQPIENPRGAVVTHSGATLSAAAQHIIRHADTFFIATTTPAAMVPEQQHPAHGVDVSHRGGRAGFVRIDSASSLTVPDFSGNFFFNTLGNIALNPRAGLLFIDFDNGDLLYLAVDAEIIWGGAEVDAFRGAERLMRFTVRHMRLREAALALRWSGAELSPALEGTGIGMPGEELDK